LSLSGSISCIALEAGVDPIDTLTPVCAAADPAAARAACAFAAGASPLDTIGCPSTGSLSSVRHIIILMQENHSFDHYLGHLPGHGQDDVDVADPSATNLTSDGTPVPWHHATRPCLDDPDHEWAPTHTSFDGGRNDGFVVASSGANDPQGNDPSGSRAMTYFDGGDLPFAYQLASTFAIGDRYFCDVLGPTFPNRLYLYAGTSFGIVTDDVDTDYHSTIFHALDVRHISWKVYRSDVAAANITLSFQLDSLGHVSDIDDFVADARADRLPDVAWIDPTFLVETTTATDEHPPADIQLGQAFVHQQVTTLMQSPAWASSVLFITYDEAGGFFDHVPPPAACPPDSTPPAQDARLGGFDRYGFRVPLYVVSPFARAHFVSHAVHSHSSILRFIETRFALPALTARDGNADALMDMFDFANPPFLTPPTLDAPAVDANALADCKATYGD
jgi:phospholipase C